MGHLNENDRAFLRKLRNENILEDVDSHLLNEKDGVIMVTCADADQMADVFKKQSEYVLDQRENVRVHTLALNGGSLVIPEFSPLNSELPKGKIILDDIAGAILLKGIKTIILYAHAPCGAAGLCNLDVKTVINYLIQSKEDLKNKFEGIKVVCFFHVDWGDHKRTYFISADKWKHQ